MTALIHKGGNLFRRHPTSFFWLITCLGFIAGVLNSLMFLGMLLLAEFGLAVYLINSTYVKRGKL